MNEEEMKRQFGQRCAALNIILDIIRESEISNRVWIAVLCKKIVKMIKEEDSPKQALNQFMDVLANEFCDVFGEDISSM